MKRIFRIFAVVFLAVYMSLSVGSATDFGFKPAVEHFDSLDGRYSYAVDKQTGEAYFTSSNEDDITVLHIPDEIDGKPIVGVYELCVRSPCVTKIVFGSNIKTVCRKGLIATTSFENEVPICSVVMNEGLEAISKNSQDRGYYMYPLNFDCPILVLPKSLSFIGEEGIAADNFDNIILQSDPETDDCAITFQGDDSDQSCNVYLPNKVKKMSEKTFYKVFIDHTHELSQYIDFPENYFDDRVHVYGNGDSYPFPVEKYTENFWENIKETEKVTLDKNEVHMKIGRQERIKASIYPTDAYDGRVFYVSLDEETASVDSEGKITAIKDGIATIRAVAASGAYADCTVTVGNPVIQSPEKPINITVISVCAVTAVVLITALIVVLKKRK